MKGKFAFDLLDRHSNSLRNETRKSFRKEMRTVKEGFRLIDSLWWELDRLPKSHIRNVKLALLCRFTNHLFSQTALAERGLILDAINCARSATETTAFYWLVCISPESASKYDSEKSPRPVEIRRELERLGVDILELRDRYDQESTVSHVGNRTDNWQIDWNTSPDGLLMIGGGSSPQLQSIILSQVFHSAWRFFLHDPLFEIVEKN
ncbi:MAG: hypothetical protein RIC36_14285 [Rhodospirillales bacterium]